MNIAANKPSNTPLTRGQSAEYLSEEGYPTAVTTLAKLACIGGGPIFRKYGARALYEKADLMAWAMAKLSRPMTSTSQAKQGPNHE